MVTADSVHTEFSTYHAFQRITTRDSGHLAEDADQHAAHSGRRRFVTRTIYAEVPPRVEYSITDRALSLFPHINSLIGWAKDNMPAILRDREAHSKHNAVK